MGIHRFLLSSILWGSLVSLVFAADWPTWRHDANRSATTSEQLPQQLHLQWTWKFPELKPAWNEDERLHFDAHYEPIVANGILYVSSPRNHSVAAIDVEKGLRKWRFFADGPIRFAPVHFNGRVYFGADDGCMYCLDAESGVIHWKFNGAASNRLAMGNERLISVWPVRTGAVVRDGRVLFTSGVWPFEGTMLYELDAETGKELRVTDLGDHSPQGYLAINETSIFIPGGRSRAYVIDRATGKNVPCSYESKGLTDYHLAADDAYLFHGDRVFPAGASSPKALGLEADRPVLDQGKIYFTKQSQLQAVDIVNMLEVEKTDRKGKSYVAKQPREIWKLEKQPVTKVHLKAGDSLLAHDQKKLLAIRTPATDEGTPSVSWSHEISGTPATMLVSNERLFVVTEEGEIHCFGSERGIPGTYREAKPRSIVTNSVDLSALVGAAEKTNGYCLYVGVENEAVLEALVDLTDFHIFVIDDDPKLVDRLRRHYVARGDYGERIVARVGDFETLRFSPYFASLVVCDKSELAGPQDVQAIYSTVRPYGGALVFRDKPVEDVQQAAKKLEKAEVSRVDGYTIVKRQGALVGSANWTHEFGDAANSLMSQDNLVKAPLGLLWYGGPSSDGSLFFDRHDWPPSAQIIDGRMFFQGPATFAAVDVYTGQMLWKLPLPTGVSPGRRSNWGSHGFHFVALSDGVYLAFPEKCVRIDPDSGEVLNEFRLAEAGDWGKIRIIDDKMVVPVFRPTEGSKEQLPTKLVALNRYSGEIVWEVESETGFSLVSMANDKVFVYEGKLAGLYVGDSKERRRGIPVPQSKTTVKSLDLNTGLVNWQRPTEYAGSWLTYSAKHDVLLMSNKEGVNALSGKDGAQLWSKRSDGEGFRGHPENYWDKVIVWDDWIIDQRGPGKSYDVRTGDEIVRINPITGTESDWQFTKVGHHCNYAIANPHMMTFRAASAGFCNIETGETSRLNGFRSGCRNSLIPANGILNAPNFGYGCTCSYSLFTSLAMVHIPDDVNYWSYSRYDEEIDEVKQVGINFGAPGDRRDDAGTMWLDYPNVGGPSPKLKIELKAADPQYFRLHPSQIRGEGTNWVNASGVEGVQSVLISVGKPESETRTFDLKFYFAEPTPELAKARKFGLFVQGNKVLEDFDLMAEAQGARRGVVRTVKGVRAKEKIIVDFEANSSVPLLSGIEISLVKE